MRAARGALPDAGLARAPRRVDATPRGGRRRRSGSRCVRRCGRWRQLREAALLPRLALGERNAAATEALKVRRLRLARHPVLRPV